MSASTQQLPKAVRSAAAIFLLYGIAVVINAVILQQMAGWEDARDFLRAILRFGGMALVAWGLTQRARWAWWLGVLLPGFWVVAGVLGLVVIVALLNSAPPLPLGTLVFTVLSLVALARAVELLLTPAARAVFRRGAV